MLTSVFAKSLRDQRWAVLGWSIAILALVSVMVALWPAIHDASADLSRLLASMPPAMKAVLGNADFTTARGFLSAQLFGVMLPVLIAILGISRGAGLLAGEEERGELTLVLARPVQRRRLFVEKAGAALLTVVVVAAVVFVILFAATRIAGMDVAAAELGGGAVGLALLGCLLASLALGIGGVTGSRTAALVGTVVAAVVFYLAAIFGRMVGSLDWLAGISPWEWSFGSNPLTDGPSLGSALAVVTLGVVVLGIGLWRFDRRDIG